MSPREDVALPPVGDALVPGPGSAGALEACAEAPVLLVALASFILPHAATMAKASARVIPELIVR